MRSDPAFLFYDGDAARDVSHMNRLERGCYFDLIQAQLKFGGYTTEQARKILGKDFETCWDSLSLILECENGIYFIGWVKKSLGERAEFAERQRKRIQDYWDKKKKEEEIPVNNGGNTVVLPIINEDEDENEDVNIDDNKIDYKGVVDLYHSLCPKMNKVAVINDFRKGLINARISEYGLPKVTEVIRIAGESEFLNGTNDKAWKADFEWIMRPQNFVKIMEGKYVNSVRKASDPKMSTKYIRNGKI